jgi:hypothetical protein
MTTLTFQADDTAPVCAVGVYCSGGSLGSSGTGVPAIIECESGAAGTTTTTTVTCEKSTSSFVYLNFECPVPSGSTWASGTWTVSLNITAANSSITLKAIYICRVSSACASEATIGSITGLSVSLGSTGIISENISGSSQTPNSGDKVIVVFEFASSSTMTAEAFAFDHSTGNTEVVSPFTAPTSTSINVSDSGSGSDAVSVQAQLSISDSGSGSDVIPSLQASFSVVDSGSGLDALSLEADLALSDSGSGLDALAVEADLTLADSGSGLDAVSLAIVTEINVADSGSGVDSVSIEVQTQISDSGSGVDAAQVQKPSVADPSAPSGGTYVYFGPNDPPSANYIGDFYWNITTFKWRYWNGTSWVDA